MYDHISIERAHHGVHLLQPGVLTKKWPEHHNASPYDTSKACPTYLLDTLTLGTTIAAAIIYSSSRRRLCCTYWSCVRSDFCCVHTGTSHQRASRPSNLKAEYFVPRKFNLSKSQKHLKCRKQNANLGTFRRWHRPIYEATRQRLFGRTWHH